MKYLCAHTLLSLCQSPVSCVISQLAKGFLFNKRSFDVPQWGKCRCNDFIMPEMYFSVLSLFLSHKSWYNTVISGGCAWTSQKGCSFSCTATVLNIYSFLPACFSFQLCLPKPVWHAYLYSLLSPPSHITFLFLVWKSQGKHSLPSSPKSCETCICRY